VALQASVRRAGVGRYTEQPRCAAPQLLHEQEIRELGLRVVQARRVAALPLQIPEVDTPEGRRAARKRDDAGGCAPPEGRQQQSRQREVTEHVGAKLSLEAISGELSPLGTAMTPALLISTSSASPCARKRVANARTDARSARSAVQSETWHAAPLSASVRTASSPRSRSRQATMIRAPALPSSSAVWKPMPLLAPVTIIKRAGKITNTRRVPFTAPRLHLLVRATAILHESRNLWSPFKDL
jgi:hypothetical protein